MLEPIYTAGNCRVAYQLHWSLTACGTQAIPPQASWRQQLQAAVEPDGVRLLAVHLEAPGTIQFLLSTKPEVCPSDAVRSVKGRLQYLLREAIPKLWQRQASIASVGEANNDVLQAYVGRQVERHTPADPRVLDVLARAQFHDPRVDLAELRSGSHGKFTHSLQLVFENAEHLPDVREDWLAKTRAMVGGVCRKKEWLLSRLAIVGNHLHLLTGCGITDSPREVALCLMNNLAFAHGMRPVYESSFYVGTFGPYDHDAIRRKLAGPSDPDKPEGRERS